MTRLLRSLSAGLLCAAALLFTAALAYASDGYAVHVQPALDSAITYVVAAISGLIGGLLVFLFDKDNGKLKKLNIDDSTRSYLEAAIYAGLKYAENKVRQSAKDVSDPKVQSEIIALALNYVFERVPDALEHFGITPAALEKMILGRFSPAGESNVLINS